MSNNLPCSLVYPLLVSGKIDKWLKRARPAPRKPVETDTTSSNTDDAQLSASGTSCSAASTSTSDTASISRDTGAASPANIGTDSGESEAAEEPRPTEPGKHRADREVGSSKKRRYDENYITLEFTYIGSKDFPQPQCVICANVLSHNCMKPSFLRRHLETKHAHLKNKPREFFERELRQLSTSKTCITATDNINKKGLEASYMVIYRVAKTGKPHTIVEDLILPAAEDMAGSTYQLLSKRASLKLQRAGLWKLSLIRSHCQISG